MPKLRDKIIAQARKTAAAEGDVLKRIKGVSNSATYIAMNDDFINSIERFHHLS